MHRTTATADRCRRRSLRLAAAGFGLVALGAWQAAPSAAAGLEGRASAGASLQIAPAVSARLSSSSQTPPRVGRLSRPLAGGKGFIYAEDGTSPTDGLTIFSVSGTTLTKIEQVAVGDSGGDYSVHILAVVRQTSGDCLEYSSGGNGTVYSFVVLANGELSATPTDSVYLGGSPGDLAVPGTTVYVSNMTDVARTIDVLTSTPGCGLREDSMNSTGDEPTIGVIGDQVVSTDLGSGDMVAYTNHDNTLTETVKEPGQFGAPYGIAVLSSGSTATVYTGQATQGYPPDGPTGTQGYRFTGTHFSVLGGSPQFQPIGVGGTVAASASERLFLQGNGEACCDETGVAWDQLTPSGMAYGGTALLQDGMNAPTEMTPVGANLLVASEYYGDLEDCALATTGVSDCHTIATLPGARTSVSGSTAVIIGNPPG